MTESHGKQKASKYTTKPTKERLSPRACEREDGGCMIPILYTSTTITKDVESIKEMLDDNNIKYNEIFIETLGITRLSTLTREMREIRTKMVNYPLENRWKREQLILPPILKTGFGTFPWWHLRVKADEIVFRLRIEQKAAQKTRLKIIKQLHYTQHKSKSGQINIDLINEARINVTILQAINGIDITDIINTWSMKERAAAIIMWRLAQHQKKMDYMTLIDMLKSKACISDPYKNNTWVGETNE